MNMQSEPRIGKKTWALIFLLISCASGTIAIFLGKDVNWDLLNYHYYNAYAFLHHRLDVDIAPAQLQSFFNPLLDVPFYLMAQRLPARTIGFLMGFVHGVNLSLVLVIFWKIARFSRLWVKALIGLAIVIVNGAAPAFISELGGTMNDNVVSIFVLTAVLLMIMASEYDAEEHSGRGAIAACAAGLVMGIGVGLKPTASFYALGLAFASIMLFDSWPGRIKRFTSYAAFGIIGTLASAGWWWWELWTRFGNPVFPLLNNIFKSPYVQSIRFIDQRFLPKHIWEYFVWPLVFGLDSARVAEVRFFDVRFMLIYVPAVGFALRLLVRERSEGRFFKTKPAIFLILFFVLTFVLWMITASIYRYLLILELLAPLLFVALLERMFRSNKALIALGVGAALVVLISSRPPGWGRVKWTAHYVEVDNTPFADDENAVVVMLGSAPLAYVIPQLPHNMRFIRAQGNLRLRPGDGFFENIKKIVREHDGPVYFLFDGTYTKENMKTALKRLDMDVRLEECFLLKTNMPGSLLVCRLADL